MGWVKIDDMFARHPKAMRAGPLGIALHVAGLCYCSQYLTDGFVSNAVTHTLLDWTGILTRSVPGPIEDPYVHTGEIVEAWMVIERLIDAGLWERCDGGYQIHDFLDYNPSREQVTAQREAAAMRQQRYKQRVSNGVSNGEGTTNNGVSNAAPVPVPVPLKELTPDVVHTTSPPRPPRRGSGKASAPSHAPTPAVRAVVNAITHALAYDESARLSEKEYERLVASAEQIVGAGGTPEQVPVRAERYARKYPSIAVTHGGLSGHWGELAVEPPAHAPPNGNGQPVTFTRQIEANNAAASREFLALMEGTADGSPTVQRQHGSPRGGLPD